MFRIGNEFLALGIHDQIQILQWNLAQQIRHIVVHFHDLEGAMTTTNPKNAERMPVIRIFGISAFFVVKSSAQRNLRISNR